MDVKMREKGFLFFIFSTILFSSSAIAYTYTEDFSQGIYWQSLPILMNKYAVNVSDGQLLQQLVTECENEWEDATGTEIWNMPSVITGEGDGSGNFIRWSDNFSEETGYDASVTLAVTIRYSTGTYFSKVVILLNGENRALKQNFSGMLRQTILHELGHTIGLGHSNESSIMYQSLTSIRHLQNDDIDGVNAAIDEMQYRQVTGFIAPFAREDSRNENKILSCGTIESNSDDSGNNSFIISLVMGLVLGFFSQLFVYMKKLPVC